MMRTHEIYEIACYRCRVTVTIPVVAVTGGKATCPNCGAELQIEFRPHVEVSQRAVVAAKMMPLQREAAKKRKSAAVIESNVHRKAGIPEVVKSTPLEDGPVKGGKARELAGKAVGVSGFSVSRAEVSR